MLFVKQETEILDVLPLNDESSADRIWENNSQAEIPGKRKATLLLLWQTPPVTQITS